MTTWTVEGRGDTFAIVDEDGVEVATVPYTDDGDAEPLDTAEGRRAILIAAAPALLAALESLVDEMQAERPCPDVLRESLIPAAMRAIEAAR
jgi:hypothetical protein